MTLTKPRDPLLAVARFCTTALMAIFAFAAAVVLFAAAVLLVFSTALPGYLANGSLHVQIAEAMPEVTPAMLTPGLLAGVALLLVIVVAMLVAGFQFLRQLRRIIDSVGVGDPFVPINAARLAQMAWLLVGLELATIPLMALGEWIKHHAHEADLAVSIDISVSNLFVALVLFILARVFREGTRLRDEVEGTV